MNPDLLSPDDMAYAPLAIQLRRLKISDSPPLLSLLKQPECRVGFGSEPFETQDDIEAWLSHCGNDGLHLVATHASVVIGFGGLFPGRGSRAHVGSLALFVHNDFYRRGVGSTLLAALVGAAEMLTLHNRLELFVFEENEAAIRLYSKFDFRIEGIHRGFAMRFGKHADAFSMARVVHPLEESILNAGDVTKLLRDIGASSRAESLASQSH